MVNRLSPTKQLHVAALIEQGETARGVARKVGIHTHTAIRYFRLARKDSSKKPAKAKPRNRPEYLAQYYKTKPHMKAGQRQNRNNQLRARIGLVLAKSPRPMTGDEIHKAILPDFPDTTRCAVGLMLAMNVEWVFERVGSHWTYRPSECWFPNEHPQYAERDQARAIWFDRYKLKDPLVEQAITTKLEHQRRRLIQRRMQTVESARPALELFAAAAAISKTKL